jgi:hypothetical protein
MTEQAPASAVHVEQQSVDLDSPGESVQPTSAPAAAVADAVSQLSLSTAASRIRQDSDVSVSDSASVTAESHDADGVSRQKYHNLRIYLLFYNYSVLNITRVADIVTCQWLNRVITLSASSATQVWLHIQFRVLLLDGYTRVGQ